MNRLTCNLVAQLMSKSLFFVFFCLFAVHTTGQDSSPNSPEGETKIEVPTIAVGLNAGVPTMLGVKFNAQLSNRLSLDLSLGLGYAGGLRYSITNPIKHRFTVYTGLYFTSKVIEESLDSMGEKVYAHGINGQGMYMPIGIPYLGKRNLQDTL